jgi:REP element-mobilizing transposase RayT
MGEHKGTTNYDLDIHHRRSIWVKGYDYSSAGAYFVTICAQNRECLFGHIDRNNYFKQCGRNG